LVVLSSKVGREKRKKKKDEDFQDGSQRKEVESMPLKVESWRDSGDTPCRQKPPRRGKTLTSPHLQPVQSISTSH
jgi:hypothetical protein